MGHTSTCMQDRTVECDACTTGCLIDLIFANKYDSIHQNCMEVAFFAIH